LFRYEASEKSRFLDGAIFGFARGTDPLILVLFEARRTGDGHRWHYGFARMATGALTAKYGEKEVFSVEKYDPQDQKKTFLYLSRQPIPKE
jgi:hypothetical protein